MSKPKKPAKSNAEKIATLKAANVKAITTITADPYLLDKTLTQNNAKIKKLL